MSSTLLSDFAYATKELYDDEELALEQYLYRERPLLAMIKKKFNSGGKYVVVPVGVSGIAGFGNDFSTTQSNINPQTGAAFQVTRKKLYSIARVDQEAVVATQNDEEAFISLAEDTLKSLMDRAGKLAAVQLYGDGTGAIAQASSVSGGVITLANPSDNVYFEKGMSINASSSLGGALRSGTGVVTGVTRGRSSATVTYSGTISSIGNTDYIYYAGTAANGGSNIAMSGLNAWIPSSAVTATAFFGVDRTADEVALAGTRYDASGLNPVEALVNGSVQVASFGGLPDAAFMSFYDYAALLNVLGDKKRYVTSNVKVTEKIDVAFKGVVVDYPKGELVVYPDAYCPKGKTWLLQMDTLTMHCAQPKFPFLYKEGESPNITMATADEWELRSTNYVQLAVRMPGYNGVIYNFNS